MAARGILLALLITLGWAAPGSAEPEEARWIRYAAISPDGEQICFSYRGDLWLVGKDGGRARLLTTHTAYERSPVWSPDGRHIAFASDRFGNFDVFVMSREGGRARRLTYYSGGDNPTGFTADGQAILFTSRRQDHPKAMVPSPWMGELYSVPVGGGRATQVLTTPAEGAAQGPDGRIAYEDRKGFEDEWRKHHTSSVARDLWIYDPKTKSHMKWTGYPGEDREPVWSQDGQSITYLSERSGSFNVWRRALAGDAEPVQLTSHTLHPVRFLSQSQDGTLCYTLHGVLYRLPVGGAPKRLTVTVAADDRENSEHADMASGGASDLALAPDGMQVAFIRRGEVYVTHLDRKITVRLTRTPEQERGLSWGEDSRSLYYATERGGFEGHPEPSWSIVRTVLTKEGEDEFPYATEWKEEQVVVSKAESFRPRVSPDGTKMAYLHERDEIRVMDLETKATRTLVPMIENYSYTDEDIDFRWSPDSRWLAVTYMPQKRWSDQVGIVNVETGKRFNVSESGYYCWRPRWGPAGRMLGFQTNRFGRRAHGSWGSDSDVMLFDLTRAARDRAALSKDDYARLLELEEEAEKENEEEKEDGASDDEKKEGEDAEDGEESKPDDAGEDNESEDDEGGDDDSDEDDEVDPIEIEFEAHDARIRRGTVHSSDMGDYMIGNKGEAIVYFAKVKGKWDLWICIPRIGHVRRVVELGSDEPGTIVIDRSNADYIYVLTGEGSIMEVDLSGSWGEKGGSAETRQIDFQADLDLDLRAERAYLFEHVWRQVERKFYDPKLHGVDWLRYKREYLAVLPHITNNHDFAEMLSEMLGELNASHTGASYRSSMDGGSRTAALGVIFDPAYTGDGLRVERVLMGGPADRADSTIKRGSIIEAIDGKAFRADEDPARLLDRKVGHRVVLRVRNPDAEAPVTEVLRAISIVDEFRLREKEWLRSRREAVEKLSDGRVGYVHVDSMDDRSFRQTYHDALGRNATKDALIVDTRFNGGGWLHDDLVAFLDGTTYLWFKPRGRAKGDLGGEPMKRWAKPSAVVMSEANYSDAHIFPWVYQKLAVGKLVGSPVAGTGTAVWWERLMDPSLTFGIPQVGSVDEGDRYLENQELQPDILVLNDPDSMEAGRDLQLEAAVQHLLEVLDK